jgi:DNA-binding transcriptional LysR family regulator
MLNHFEEIRIYVEVVKSGNFTVAAKSLAISKQMVSRRMMALEERLGARLLNRTTRKLSPTELGKVFYERCVIILQGMQEAEQAVSNQSGELRGLLRISAPLSFASMMLSPALNAFMLQHPHLQVCLDVDNRLVDVIGDGYDMVIRITRQPDDGLIARKLMDAAFVYCCSPAYAQQHGIPQTLNDIKTHRCITHPSAEWLFKQDGEVRKMQIHPVLRSSHGEVMREAAIAGLGITGLPEFYVTQAIQNGRLTPILQAYTFDIDGVYAMYPQHRQLSPMVQAFTQHLQAWFAR